MNHPRRFGWLRAAAPKHAALAREAASCLYFAGRYGAAVDAAVAAGDLRRAHSYSLFGDPTSSRGFDLRKRSAERAAARLGLDLAEDWVRRRFF